MAHTNGFIGDKSFTSEETKAIAYLLKHPQIAKLIEEIKKKEESDKTYEKNN